MKNYIELMQKSFVYAIKGNSPGFINSTAYNAKYILDTYFRKNYIFIHINKNAGSSIEDALGDKEQIHLDAKTIMTLIGTEMYYNKFSFAFVRNPFDRIVSQYQYRYDNNQTNIKKEKINFEHWLNLVLIEKNKNYRNHPLMFQSQKNWISDMDEDVIVDFVGRYENLHEDFKIVSKRLQLKDSILLHRRKSSRQPYKKYFNPLSRKLIEDKYKDDLDYFNYSF